MRGDSEMQFNWQAFVIAMIGGLVVAAAMILFLPMVGTG